MPKVSVIVPVYKTEAFLPRCIDSILAQTFTDFELILVDDGSPDNCGTICDEYAQKNGRIRVLHQENQGQAAARNNAVTQAAGEWVCFVDSDDIIHPQMLEVLYGALKTDIKISMCGTLETPDLPQNFEANDPLDVYFEEIKINEFTLTRWCHSFYFHTVTAKMISIDIIKQHPFTNGKVYEDTALVCYWLKSAGNVSATNAQLYFYYINQGGTTKSEVSLKRVDDFLWAARQMLEFSRVNEYSSLHSEIATDILRVMTSDYFNAVKTNGDAAKKIKMGAKKIYLENRHTQQLTPNEIRHLYEMLYPGAMTLYWYWKAALRKLGLQK